MHIRIVSTLFCVLVYIIARNSIRLIHITAGIHTRVIHSYLIFYDFDIFISFYPTLLLQQNYLLFCYFECVVYIPLLFFY